MAKKLRELKAALRRAGFFERTGKGSHTVWSHPELHEVVVLSGHDGDEAKPYQEKDVYNIMRKLESLR
jgi:predicted RNA binding protein YcfA (HicA-like mRNA interferase family)